MSCADVHALAHECSNSIFHKLIYTNGKNKQLCMETNCWFMEFVKIELPHVLFMMHGVRVSYLFKWKVLSC